MLTYIDANLFDSPAQALVNTVNTVGVMGKGIALQFKQLYPEMFERYKKFCEDGSLTVGKLYVYRTPNKIVVNFPTKKHWRQPSRVEYIEAGLEKFVSRYADYGISSVSFPQLGCGNGELDWEKQVKPIMEKYLKNLPIPTYIHIYTKPANFIPERLEKLDKQFIQQIQLERQEISFSTLWQDLQKVAKSASIKENDQISLEITNESIIFKLDTDSPIVIYCEDVEELWNILRLNGTLKRNDVPVQITSQANGKGVDLLFNLFPKLPYILKAQLRTFRDSQFQQGLRYSPLPSVSKEQNLELAF